MKMKMKEVDPGALNIIIENSEIPTANTFGTHEK